MKIKLIRPLQKLLRGITPLIISFLLLMSFTVFAQNKPAQSSVLSNEETTVIVNRHFEVLNLQDSVIRLKEMNKIYTSNFHIVDTFFEYFNYKDFNGAVDLIHQKFPGSKFSVTNLTIIPNVARASWKLGNELIGENVFIFKYGKVKTILAFVQPTVK